MRGRTARLNAVWLIVALSRPDIALTQAPFTFEFNPGAGTSLRLIIESQGEMVLVGYRAYRIAPWPSCFLLVASPGVPLQSAGGTSTSTSDMTRCVHGIASVGGGGGKGNLPPTRRLRRRSPQTAT